MQHALEPRLWERHRLHRGYGELGEVDVHPAPREAGERESRPGRGAGGFEPLELTPVAQHVQDLPAEAARLLDLAGLRQPVEHHHSHTGPAQLAGQHQAGRACAHDDHVGVRHRPLPCWSRTRTSRVKR